MTLEEIEERVKHSLEALNSPDEHYDWRLTHFNSQAWADLQEGCYALSQEKATELDLKNLIKEFRDASVVSYTDFHIKVAEPTLEEFKRMEALFGHLHTYARLLPPRDEGDRRAYLQLKTLEAMRLTMEHKQTVSEKLRQQFTYLMVRATVKTPEMLAVQVMFEGYNPYAKHLASAPTVKLRNHFVTPEPETDPVGLAVVTAPATPMFAPSTVDNSSFESRLPPSTKSRATRSHSPLRRVVLEPQPEPIVEGRFNCAGDYVIPTHELPSEIHEEFAAYCETLYEKAKGN